MKLLWLGQNGLLFDFDGTKIMIDPYLTDSLSKEDKFFSRKIKLNKKLYKASPDVIILSNGHLDHADNDSIEKLLKYTGKKKKTIILSCESVYNDITTVPSMSFANHIMFEKNSEWTINNINIRAVPAKTDDRSAFGVVITDFSNNKKYYIACDTLYNSYVLDNIPNDIYATFLPINGEFGSMNVTDAKRVAEKVKSRFYVPVHFGMFDKVDPKFFDLPNTVIPKPYKIINFDDLESTVPNPNKTVVDKEDDENSNALPPSSVILSNDEEQINNNSNNEVDSIQKDEENNADDNNDYVDMVEENNNASNIPPLNDENVFSNCDVAIEEVDDGTDDLEDVDADEVNTDEVGTDEVDADEVNTDEVGTDEVDADEIDTYEVDADMIDNNEVCTDETENIEYFDDEFSEDITDKDTVDCNEALENTESKNKFMNDSDRIDAYIKEIEKFERGETTDFSSIDDQ